jgi:hypothetical protein
MISLETITSREFIESDRLAVQARAIASVNASPQLYFDKYIADSRSFDGRYVCADLFKECFPEYAQSNYACSRYNTPVHNSAAVLASAQFHQTIARIDSPSKNTAVFLTGIPGAGKTSLIVQHRQLDDALKVIYEGQLSRPQSGITKIAAALEQGLQVQILVAHANPQDALTKTYKRFGEVGRGATLDVMASIQGRLPAGLEEIHGIFGKDVHLTIVDVRDRSAMPVRLSGWEHLPLLQSEGNYETIKNKLTEQLETDFRRGNITSACYSQAHGRVVEEAIFSMGGQSSTLDAQNVLRRGVPQTGSTFNDVTPYVQGKLNNLQRAKDSIAAPPITKTKGRSL